MQINMIRSDKVYQEMLELPLEKREGCFRAKILAPFATKYQTQHIPLKAKYPQLCQKRIDHLLTL